MRQVGPPAGRHDRAASAARPPQAERPLDGGVPKAEDVGETLGARAPDGDAYDAVLSLVGDGEQGQGHEYAQLVERSRLGAEPVAVALLRQR